MVSLSLYISKLEINTECPHMVYGSIVIFQVRDGHNIQSCRWLTDELDGQMNSLFVLPVSSCQGTGYSMVLSLSGWYLDI